MKKGFMLLAAAAILTACSSPKNTYYTLNAPDLPATTALTHKTRVMVGPVTVPSLVDSPQLVLKDSANQVTIYEYHRWGGSLKTDIERVVAADLSRDLMSPNVWSYSQSPFAQFDYQVFIDVQNMECKLGDTVSLDVLWTVKPTADKASKGGSEGKTALKPSGCVAKSQVVTGRSVVREPVSGDGFDALVAAQSRAFDKVSDEIAKVICTD